VFVESSGLLQAGTSNIINTKTERNAATTTTTTTTAHTGFVIIRPTHVVPTNIHTHKRCRKRGSIVESHFEEFSPKTKTRKN
jgi:hypothetical protein